MTHDRSSFPEDSKPPVREFGHLNNPCGNNMFDQDGWLAIAISSE
jgi:hypothetical protein